MDLSHTQKQLFACLRLEQSEPMLAALRLLPADEWQNIAQLAIKQQVAPLLYHRLQAQPALAHGVPPALLAHLQKLYHQNSVRNLLFVHELDRIVQALQAQKIPVVILKGAHLIAAVYENRALRFMGDLDILVPPEQVPAAVEAMHQMGYAFIITQNPQREAYTDNHVPALVKAAVAVELHHTLTPPACRYHVDLAELWTRTTPVKLVSAAAAGFCAEDLLLHLCEHMAYQHVFDLGLRGLCDVDLVIRHYQAQLDWAALAERANRWGWSRGVYLTLYLAKHLLGTPIDEERLRLLQAGAFSPHLAQEALTHLFATKGQEGKLSRNFIQMVQGRDIGARLRIPAERLFLPRQRMADLYRVPVNSPLLYLCYMRRCAYFMRQYWGTLYRLLRGETTLAQRIQRQNSLIEWMEPSSLP